MVQPTSFCVRYIINPWMDGNVGAVDKPLAIRQWNNLVATLNVVGFHTVVLPEAPANCPDAVFVANAGLIFDNTFIPSLFKYVNRVPEEQYFEDYFVSEHYNVWSLYAPVKFEGAGDALFSSNRKILFIGNGLRTDKIVAEHIAAKWMLFETVQLDLVDPNFYHLDTCFCPLDTGDLLWHPPAFSPESVAKILSLYPEDKRIGIFASDASMFACNAISVGKNIITPTISRELRLRLIKLE